MGALVGYGTYLPHHRLRRTAIGAALGSSGGQGSRSVASYDEDSTSMAVEAGRSVLRRHDVRDVDIVFATTSPAYLEKGNATGIHAALDLPMTTAAWDLVGSVRTASAALALGAADGDRLVLLSDRRTGLPGGADESGGGDAAVALLFGDGPALLEVLGSASETVEVLERWRLPGDPQASVWEERFGEHVLVPLARRCIDAALSAAGVDIAGVDHLVVSGPPAKVVNRLVAAVGAHSSTGELLRSVGDAGIAAGALGLADVLDRAAPGEVVVVATVADGVDVHVYRTTLALADYDRPTAVRTQIDATDDALDYTTFLTWTGQLRREPPRRPDPARPAAPPSFRQDAWKFAFRAGRCEECGLRHLPPQRVCNRCQSVDRSVEERLADVPATIVSYTVDRLAHSLAPPVIAAVLDFDGGGRFQCELTDVGADEVQIGDRVQMTFRRLYTGGGVHNYFWKARPLVQSAAAV